jgi:hypothetical protein
MDDKQKIFFSILALNSSKNRGFLSSRSPVTKIKAIKHYF